MAGKLAVVVGITGKQGGSAAKSLLEAGYKVRGITRDPTKASAKAWTDQGVEMVAADLSFEDSLKAAFKGAQVIFTNTDFWLAARDPMMSALAQAEGRPVNELAYDVELQQQKNMIHAAAATLPTLERLVFSMIPSTRAESNGKYKHVFHFDSKGDAATYLRQSHPELAAKTSFLILAFYTDAFTDVFMKPQKQADGSYFIGVPLNGDRRVPVGDPSKITGPFVRALVEAPAGKMVLALSGTMSMNEAVVKIGKHLGIDLRFREIPPQAWIDMIPVFGLELAEMMQYVDEIGYAGSNTDGITPEQLGLDVKRETLDESIDAQDWSVLLK